MAIVPKNYFKPVGRPYEVIFGVVCTAICLFFTVLSVWFAYRAHAVGNLFKVASLIFISILFIVAIGFSSLAHRLFSEPASRKKPLLSNFVLYFMGIFFLVCSVALTIGILYCKIKGISFDGPAGYVVTTFLMGAGSIKLAIYRRRKSIQPQFSPDR